MSKGHRVQVVVTDELYAWLERRAERRGTTVAAELRALALIGRAEVGSLEVKYNGPRPERVD